VDQRASERGDQTLLQRVSALRTEVAYESAADCQACAEIRVAEQQADALCDRHLGQAMGDGGWDAEALARGKR